MITIFGRVNSGRKLKGLQISQSKQKLLQSIERPNIFCYAKHDNFRHLQHEGVTKALCIATPFPRKKHLRHLGLSLHAHSSLCSVLVLLKVGLVVCCIRIELSNRNAEINLEGEQRKYSGTVTVILQQNILAVVEPTSSSPVSDKV